MRAVVLMILLSTTAGMSWSFSFSELAVEAGLSSRLASYAHEEGALAYEVDEYYLLAITYSPSRSTKYGFETGMSFGQYQANSEFLGETQSFFSMTLFASKRLPITRASDFWLGAGFGSRLSSHKNRHSVTHDGYLNQVYDDIPFEFAGMAAQVRATYQVNDLLGVELPFGIGIEGLLEKGFSERSGAASLGAKFIF